MTRLLCQSCRGTATERRLCIHLWSGSRGLAPSAKPWHRYALISPASRQLIIKSMARCSLYNNTIYCTVCLESVWENILSTDEAEVKMENFKITRALSTFQLQKTLRCVRSWQRWWWWWIGWWWWLKSLSQTNHISKNLWGESTANSKETSGNFIWQMQNSCRGA